MRSRVATEQTLLRLNRTVFALGTLIVVGGLGLAGVGAFFSIRDQGLATEEKLNQQELAQLRKSLPSEPIVGPKELDGMQAAVDFQSQIQRAAGSHGCTVSFDSVGDAALFVTKFDNAPPDESWRQIELQLSVNGPLRSVMQTLAAFRDFGVPFEFGDLSFERDRVVEAVRVTARLSVRVLFRN